jgi:hypothetical protein
VLKDIFGPEVPAPRAVARTNWSQDPHARGSYSFVRVGSNPEDIEALAESIEGRVHFAGEATYRGHWAAAHGAYVSGLRAAARIANDPSLLPGPTSTESRRWREMMMRASRFFGELSNAISAEELETRLAVLRESAVFSVVPPKELKVLATMFERRSFAAGECLCRAGDEATAAFLIGEGVVDVRVNDRHVASLRRSEVVGEFGMFVGGRRTATLVAQDRCDVLLLDYQRFQRFLLACPEACVSLLKATVQRTVVVNQALAAARAGVEAARMAGSATLNR